MKKATDGRRNGIQWTMFNQLDDLHFADDIALLSHSHQQMQDKLTQVERRAAETGLHINTKTTKVLKSNTKTRADLTVNCQNLPNKDVKIRIEKARTAFNMMRSIWKARHI